MYCDDGERDAEGEDGEQDDLEAVGEQPLEEGLPEDEALARVRL